MTTIEQINEIIKSAIDAYVAVPYEDRQLSLLRDSISKVLEILDQCKDKSYKELLIASEGGPYQDLVMLAGAIKYLQQIGLAASITMTFLHEKSPEDAPTVNFRMRFDD